MGKRTWKAQLVTTGQDEKYDYDGLYQISDFARGTLNINRTARWLDPCRRRRLYLRRHRKLDRIHPQPQTAPSLSTRAE